MCECSCMSVVRNMCDSAYYILMLKYICYSQYLLLHQPASAIVFGYISGPTWVVL